MWILNTEVLMRHNIILTPNYIEFASITIIFEPFFWHQINQTLHQNQINFEAILRHNLH